MNGLCISVLAAGQQIRACCLQLRHPALAVHLLNTAYGPCTVVPHRPALNTAPAALLLYCSEALT